MYSTMKKNIIMKINFLKIGFYTTMFAMTLFAASCESGEHGDHEGHDHDHQHQHEQGHDHDDHEGHDHEDHEGHQHQQEEGQEETSSINTAGKEYTSAYICPMHCEGSGSDKEGKCPVCKMDYEENATM
jgi:ABC-type nickel/cobalt efflux system permease component RcnA